MNKEELIQVYQNTKEICADIEVPESIKYSKLFEGSFIPKKGEIIIEPLDTISALIKYFDLDNAIAVLNMASSKRKGGGVENGSVAQEECLFRCSNIFNIPDEFYPILSDEYIYTIDVSFVKNANYELIPTITADVITMPALNRNKTHIDNLENKDSLNNYKPVMTEKIEKMFDGAAFHLCDNIILGAWGCGVFKNDPNVVAELFNEVIAKKRLYFDKIIFAVINDNNSVANNYEIFKKVIKTDY
jgi:uncharacterized protein (TIGR02452 family)